MIIDGFGDDYIDDWFELGRHAKTMWNGHLLQQLSSASDHRNNRIVAMIKEPSEVSIRGAYSQEHGVDVEFRATWRNDPAPPPSKERENSYEREHVNNERESLSRDRSSKEPKSHDE